MIIKGNMKCLFIFMCVNKYIRKECNWDDVVYFMMLLMFCYLLFLKFYIDSNYLICCIYWCCFILVWDRKNLFVFLDFFVV